MASASLAGLAFPAVRPVYGPDGADAGKVLGLMGDVVDFTYGEIAGHGANASTENYTDYSELSVPVMAMPAPEDFLAAIAPPGIPDTVAKDNIYKTLVGKNITYYSVAGRPMDYTITADSIKGIDSWVYKNKPAWKVRVGQGMAWDLIMDASGTKILSTDQLFRT